MAISLTVKLRNLREKKEYSLDKLAEITGISKSYLWELENRKSRSPSAEKLSKVADALGVTLEYLLDDAAAQPDKDVIKNAFFRKFDQLADDDQRKIQDIIEMWSKKDGTS